MRRITTTACIAVIVTCVLATAAAGQRVQRHRGFWLGFGLGGGWSEFDWSFGNAGRGGAVYVRLGGTVNQHVLVGGEALAWFRSERNGPDTQRTNATFTALVYPGSRGGLFFKGGFGVATYTIDSGADREGVGVTLGSGFDFRLARNFYVTPNVDVLTQFLSNQTSAALLFTIGLGWH